MLRYFLYHEEMKRFVDRIASRYGVSRLAAETLIEQYLDLVVQAEPDLVNEQTGAFTPEGRLDVLSRLGFYTDPIIGNVVGAHDPLLNAIQTAALMAREYDKARDDLVRIAMSNKAINRTEIATMAGIKTARAYQIAGARQPQPPAPLDMPKHLLIPANLDEAAPIGTNLSGETVTILLRHLRGAVVGQRGSGKTTFLHLLTLLLGRCADSLIWHLGLNNSGLSNHWLAEYALGNVGDPFIDWPANTPDEAIAMLEVARALIKVRKQTSGIHRGNPTPQVTIVADELGSIGDSRQERRVRALLASIANEDPTLGVTIVGSALRPTLDALPRPLTERDTTLRAAGRIRDRDELALLFRNFVQIDGEDLDRGTLAVETADMDAEPVLVYLTTSNDIRAATRQLQQARVASRFGALELDKLGTAYTERWTHPDVVKMLRVLAAGDDEEKLRAALA